MRLELILKEPLFLPTNWSLSQCLNLLTNDFKCKLVGMIPLNCGTQTAAEAVISGANPLVWTAEAALIWFMESDLFHLLLLFKAGRRNVS